MSVRGTDIVDAARHLLGVWYVWWQDGDPIPMWLDEWGNSAPSISHMSSVGVMCSDLVNYARMECGLPSIGGTPAYYDWLISNRSAEGFDPNTPGVPGAICVNPGPWRGDYVLSQGHICIYTDDHTLIQATDGVGSFAGVNEGEQDYDSHQWANYWLYGLMPDVDYSNSGVESSDQLWTPDEVESVAVEEQVNWYGIGADNVVRLGGPDTDWSNGWLGTALDGSLVRAA